MILKEIYDALRFLEKNLKQEFLLTVGYCSNGEKLTLTLETKIRKNKNFQTVSKEISIDKYMIDNCGEIHIVEKIRNQIKELINYFLEKRYLNVRVTE